MRLEVSDDGVGMQESLLRHLGEAMLLSSATRRQEFFVKGTGLGFTICRRIAAQHGGRMIVSSGPVSGTRVRVWLRADQSQPDKFRELAPIEVEVLP
jgi:signal transduction histidine kinase